MKNYPIRAIFEQFGGVVKEEKKINRRIRRIEVQSQRACTALLALGPALDPQTIINADDEKKKMYFFYFIFGVLVEMIFFLS